MIDPDQYGVFDLDNGMKAMQVNLKFETGRVSPNASAIHIFTAAYAEWYSGVPHSFRIRYATLCGGRQTYTAVPAHPRQKVTCARCKKRRKDVRRA